MGNTTTDVGRLKLAHPDIGSDGGSTLHTQVRNAWTKISDMVNSRFYTEENLADSSSVDFEHNFKVAFVELRFLLYLWDPLTDELTRLVSGGIPDLDDFTIVATPGNLTTQIRVTNNTGSDIDIALVVVHGRGAEVLSDLDDFDNSGVVNGYVPRWVAANNRYEPQSLTVTTWNTIVKENINYTASDKDEIFASCSSGNIEIQLPSGPAIGERVRLLDYNGSWGSPNKVIVNGNGNNIMGSATYDLTIPDTGMEFIYNGTEWRTLI